LEVQYECREKEERKSQNKRLSRQPQIEGNISQFWNNGGTVLQEEMIGKAVRSILEEELNVDAVSIFSESEAMNVKLSDFVTGSNLTEEHDQSINIHSRPSPINLQEANPHFSFQNNLVIILTSTGTILLALLAMAVLIKMVSNFIISSRVCF
jgi:hypothetical protein